MTVVVAVVVAGAGVCATAAKEISSATATVKIKFLKDVRTFQLNLVKINSNQGSAVKRLVVSHK